MFGGRIARGSACSTAAAGTEDGSRLCDAALGWCSEKVIAFASYYSSGTPHAMCSDDFLQQAKEVVTSYCTAVDTVLEMRLQ